MWKPQLELVELNCCMLISEGWIPFEMGPVQSLPFSYGVFEIADDFHNVIFIGSGRINVQLKKRYLEMRHIECLRMAKWFRFETAESQELAEKRERTLKEEYRQQFGNDPICN